MAKKIPNPIDRSVGARIRMQRMMRGLSQTDLGKAVGVTFQQVQKYENGSNRVGASRLQQIANVLTVKPDFFFEDEGFSGFGDVAGMQDFISSRDGVSLARAFTRISDKKLRSRIVSLVQELTKA